MDLERETVMQIVVAAIGVGLFLLALLVISVRFNDGGLSSQGGLALVGAIAGFVVVMSGLGYFLSGRDA